MRDITPSRRYRNLILFLIFIVVLAAAFTLAIRYLWHYFRNPEELRVLVKSWGAWAPLGVVVFQMVQVVVAPLPGNVMAFAGGYALGFWPTIVWLMLGVILGASLAFALARFFGRGFLRVFVPADVLGRFDRLLITRGTFYLFLLLLVPNPLGDWVYYLAGLSRIGFLYFLILVLIARLPSNIIECGLGASAIRFGVREWVITALMITAITVAYLLNQRRVERLLLRLAGLEPEDQTGKR